MSDYTVCTLTNAVVGSVNKCTHKVEYFAYGYNPSKAAGVIFSLAFGLCTLVHTFQAFKGRRWFVLFTMVLCGAIETLGWAARLWSAISVQWNASTGGFWYSNSTAFTIQIAVLIIAPAFWSAGAYIALGKLIQLNRTFCRFNTRTYSKTFIIGDIFSLLVQAFGGAYASGADNLDDANIGADIMLGGVLVQVLTMTLFSIVLAEYIYRFYRKRPVKKHFRMRRTQPLPSESDVVPLTAGEEAKVKRMIAALVIASVLIFVRSIYRVSELVDGWSGKVITNQALFSIFDALQVLLALATFNVVPVYKYIPRPQELTHASMSGQSIGLQKLNDDEDVQSEERV